MFAEVRYESALFIVPVVALLLAFRLVGRALLRPYAFVYALTPAYLAPRIWQAVLRGSVPPQDPGVAPFGLDHFLSNTREYFAPVLSPFNASAQHAGLVIALGLLGGLLWLRARGRSLRDWKDPGTRFALFVAAWMLLQTLVVFSYAWGRAQAPSAARLVIALDTFFSFLAAWAVAVALNRWRPFVAVGAAVLALYLPAAAQQRMMNRLIQTRETATAWRFFDSLHEKRILIVTDRPDLFTIMDYGAMSFDGARQDPFIFQAWGRHLFYDIYVVQQVRLSTNTVMPGYEIWPDRKLDTMLEYQNDADVAIRISRLAR
jgi:hypothetical protein